MPTDRPSRAATAPGGSRGAGIVRLRIAWRRRKWLALAVLAVVGTVGLSFVVFLPNVYRATARVLVEGQQVPEEFVKPTVTSPLDTRLLAITHEILSRPQIEELIERFDLYRELRPRMTREALLERARRDIEIELLDKNRRASTVAFTVAFLGADPQTVADVTNALAAFYVDGNIRSRERQASGTAEFLRAELEQTKARLDAQERVLSDFKKRNLGMLPDQLQSNLATLKGLNEQLLVNSDRQARALERERVPSPRGGGSGDPSDTARASEDAATTLARLRDELERLLTRYTEGHPAVIRIKAEIAGLEKQLSQGTSGESSGSGGRARGGRAAEAHAEVLAARQEEQRLRAAIRVYEQRIEETPRREQEFEELSRGYTTTKQLYEMLVKRLEEARLAESMELRQKGEQFRVLEPAVPPERPAGPNRVRLAVVVIGLALSLAGCAVIVAHQMDTSFHSVEELRAAVAIPVLVTVPDIVTAADQERRQRWAGVAMASIALGLSVLVGLSYLVAHGNGELSRLLVRG